MLCATTKWATYSNLMWARWKCIKMHQGASHCRLSSSCEQWGVKQPMNISHLCNLLPNPGRLLLLWLQEAVNVIRLNCTVVGQRWAVPPSFSPPTSSTIPSLFVLTLSTSWASSIPVRKWGQLNIIINMQQQQQQQQQPPPPPQQLQHPNPD